MTHPFNIISDQDKAEILKQASNIFPVPAHAIEKDWWVVQTLSIIFSMDIATHLVFKGGTSLSKGWELIERFSEDIDLAIDRKRFGMEGDLSRKEIDKLRKTAGAFVEEKFYSDLQQQLQSHGFTKVVVEIEPGERSDRDRSILLNYPYVAEYPGYILPRIKIEFSCRSLMEPSTPRSFSSMVDRAFADSKFSEQAITIPTVNPERTFLEKIFLLHEEFSRPSVKIRSGERMSRHLYDIVKLSKTEFANTALATPELYNMIVRHRSQLNIVPGIDYSRHEPQFIVITPPDTIIKEWEADYKRMLEEMIYEEDAPKFDELLESLKKINQRINQLDWKLG